MDDDRRVITSAIDGMSVAEVRRALATLRRTWEEASTEGRPFYLTGEPLVRDHSVQQFSYMFVRGHHAKRLSKNRQATVESPPHRVASAGA